MLPAPLLDPPIGASAPLDELVLDPGLAGQEVPAHRQQCKLTVHTTHDALQRTQDTKSTRERRSRRGYMSRRTGLFCTLPVLQIIYMLTNPN
jgi:hypothetical protein